MSTSSSEYLLTTSEVSQQWTACLWDYSAKSIMHVYKNGGSALSRSLNSMGNSFLLTAEQEKPLLHMWPFNSSEQVKNVRLVLPGIASTAVVSPDNTFIVIGIDRRLYVWQICNGKLLTVQEKHLQPITCAKFSANSDYLLTASRDGTVLAYNFGDLVCSSNNYLNQTEIGQVEPVYSRMDHTFTITDMHIGGFGLKSRFVTVSMDCTCRVYDLLDGKPLLQLVFDEPLTCVVADSAFWNLFVGAKSGLIRQFRLHDPPRTFTHHLEPDNELNFVGHKEAVTCLDLNVTNMILVSGSDDRQVFTWNIKSRQILNRIEHKGRITNVRFLLTNKNLFSQDFRPEYALKTFERTIDTDNSKFTASTIQDEDLVFSDDDDNDDHQQSEDYKKKLKCLEDELNNVKVINKQLYLALTKKQMPN